LHRLRHAGEKNGISAADGTRQIFSRKREPIFCAPCRQRDGFFRLEKTNKDCARRGPRVELESLESEILFERFRVE
jgi:hypothetical protein